jgi:heat shock protein HslJ
MKTNHKLAFLFMAAVMIFLLNACTPKESAELTGTKWSLVSYGEASSVTQAVSGATTLDFGGDGKISGKAGCNSYGGRYTINGTDLKFGEVISTLMACADENLMRQESEYLMALQSAAAFEMSGDRLVIHYDSNQSVLTFEKTGQAN